MWNLKVKTREIMVPVDGPAAEILQRAMDKGLALVIDEMDWEVRGVVVYPKPQDLATITYSVRASA